MVKWKHSWSGENSAIYNNLPCKHGKPTNIEYGEDATHRLYYVMCKECGRRFIQKVLKKTVTKGV
jgi:hypothetical protein